MPYQNYPTIVYEDLRQMLRAVAARREDKVFLTQYKGDVMQTLSYRGFLSRVDALGTALYLLGLQDKKVMIMGKNSIDWVTAYMAVVCGGGVAVPVSRELTQEAFARVYKASGAEVIILSEKCKQRLGALPKKLRVILFEQLPTLISRGKEALAAGDRRYLDVPIDPSAMRVLLYTSGTTNAPRGVMLSHRNLCFNLSQMCKMVQITTEDVFLSILPLHHAYEATCGFLCPLYCGASVVFARNLRHLQEDLREHRPTVMLTVPLLMETLWRNLLLRLEKNGYLKTFRRAVNLCRRVPGATVRQSVQSKIFADLRRVFGGRLRLLISGGASADPRILADLSAVGITALQGYGMTECSPLMALNRDCYYNHASAGLSTPETLLDIVDVQSDGTGEIRFRGDNIMLGYYNDPDATAERICDGWLYTGDLGYIDENGFLYITGRKKNVIVTAGGRNVYPEELEAALERTPYIRESLVVGIFNSKKRNSDVVAWIFPDQEALEGLLGEEEREEGMLLEMKKAVSGVNATLQPYQQIKGFLIRREDFPRNAAGKILRQGLAEEAAKEAQKGSLYR